MEANQNDSSTPTTPPLLVNNEGVIHVSPSPSVQYVPSSPTPSVEEVAPIPIRPPGLFESNAPHPPISPRTAETILRLPTDPDKPLELIATARAVAFSLITTINTREAAAQQRLKRAHEGNRRLEDALRMRDTEIARLRLCAGHVDIPAAFQQNEGRCNIQVSNAEGDVVVA